MLKEEIAKINAMVDFGSLRTKQQLVKSRRQIFHRRIKVGSLRSPSPKDELPIDS